jgi:hypothetical protein
MERTYYSYQSVNPIDEDGFLICNLSKIWNRGDVAAETLPKAAEAEGQ